MLILTNSSNGEDIYSGVLEQVLGDTSTPLEWEGLKASASAPARNRPATTTNGIGQTQRRLRSEK